MSVFDRLNPFGGSDAPTLDMKASKTTPLIFLPHRVAPQYTPRSYLKFAQVGYVQNPIVHACVRKIAESCARIPYGLFKGEGKRRQEVETHAMLDLLKRPNAQESGADWMRRTVSFKVITGNAFWERVQVGTEVRELYSLRPDRMTIKMEDRGGRMRYEYAVNGQKQWWVCDYEKGFVPIWHWKSFHPTDDFWGMGALDPSMRSVDMFGAFLDHNKALLDNGATPSGAFKYNPKDGGQTGTGKMPDSMFAGLKKMIDDRFMSGKNAGRPLLLEGGLEWQPFGFSPQDMNSLEGQREAARLIALAFGVPPMILGIPGDNTYANLKEANADFHRSTVMPMMDDLLKALSRWLGPAFGDEDLMLAFDEDEIPALADEREKKWTMVAGADWLTTNEKRRATGYDALSVKDSDDEHDQVLAPAAKTPLGVKPDGDEAGTGLDVEPEDDAEIKPPPKGKLNGAAGQPDREH